MAGTLGDVTLFEKNSLGSIRARHNTDPINPPAGLERGGNLWLIRVTLVPHP